MADARAWKEKMQPASFRGVSFEVAAAADEFGRATVIHTYPQGTGPYVEDLGDAGRTVEIQGFLYGSDYMARRDALEEAFRQEGPGELVHPWYGRLTVALAGPVKGTQTSADGGYYTFSAKFVRVDSPSSGLSGKASLTSMVRSEASSVTGIAKDIANGIDIGKTTSWTVLQATRAVWNFVHSTLTILNTDSKVTPFSEAVMALGASASEVTDSTWLPGIVENGALGAEMAELVSKAAGAATADAMSLVRLAEAAPAFSAMTGLGASRAKAQDAQNVISSSWKMLAVSEACRAASETVPASSEDARALMDGVFDAVDSAMLIADDDAYSALQDLRAVTVRAMAAKAGGSPGVVTADVAVSMPSLAIVYALNGTIDSEDDLITRNEIRHPGFVPGGRPVELINA